MYPNQKWQKDDMNTVWDLNPVTLCLLAAMVKDVVEVKIIDAQFYSNVYYNPFLLDFTRELLYVLIDVPCADKTAVFSSHFKQTIRDNITDI